MRRSGAIWLVSALAPLAAGQPAPDRTPGSCKTCHPDIVRSYTQTAHFQTSRAASAESIRGSFAEPRNILRTGRAGTFFKMERRGDHFFQTGYQKAGSRTERFDLVIGSGRRGQSYLYWRGGLLFQLPVSYFAGTDDWVNSPGYPDGTVHFDRVITPRCLECHTTYFSLSGDFPNAKYRNDYTLGISCQRCHGEESSHPEIRNPARFSRDRKIDGCALCHSGIREARKAPFTYRPGEPVDLYLEPESEAAHARPDVHGNQVGLLRRSKCYQASPEMSCASCHNVHRVERDPVEMSGRCGSCHEAARCKLAAQVGPRIGGACVACHMPVQNSQVIAIDTPGKRLYQPYRTHLIAVYREATPAVLRSLRDDRR